MKIVSEFLGFINRIKKTLVIVGTVIIAYTVYNSTQAKYHKKEIKQLESKISDTEKLYNSAVLEIQKFRDSVLRLERTSRRLDSTILVQNARITVLQSEKARALRKVRDIEQFLKQRYAHVEKANDNIVVDKNDSKEIVSELIEKDYLVQEVALLNENKDTLTSQVNILKISLDFSKQETSAINSALEVKTQENDLQKELNALLEKDLKKAKRRNFWNTVKGIGVGVGAGMVIGKTIQ